MLEVCCGWPPSEGILNVRGLKYGSSPGLAVTAHLFKRCIREALKQKATSTCHMSSGPAVQTTQVQQQANTTFDCSAWQPSKSANAAADALSKFAAGKTCCKALQRGAGMLPGQTGKQQLKC